jgi:hypothetical protein
MRMSLSRRDYMFIEKIHVFTFDPGRGRIAFLYILAINIRPLRGHF